MAHFTVMPIGPNCLNCQAALPGTARFCPQCGQKVDARRLTLHDIGRELWHALTHTDRSVLGVMKAMLLPFILLPNLAFWVRRSVCR